MNMPRYIPKSVPGIGIQDLCMKHWFPQLLYKNSSGQKYWEGKLQTSNGQGSILYTVKIVYRYERSPRVYVINPAIDKNAPHRYPDNSLCLYFPPERSWHANSMIAKTIVPWICEWLYNYEVWLEYGEWYADEVKHDKAKIRD